MGMQRAESAGARYNMKLKLFLCTGVLASSSQRPLVSGPANNENKTSSCGPSGAAACSGPWHARAHDEATIFTGLLRFFATRRRWCLTRGN
eukprot:5940424-Pyramimonas_sp.AAC.1